MKTSLLIVIGLLIAVAGGVTGYLDYRASIPEYTRTGVPGNVQREYDGMYQTADEAGYEVRLERCGSKNAKNSYLTIFVISSTYSYDNNAVSATFYSDEGEFITSDYRNEEYDKYKPGMYREPSLIDIDTYSCLLLSTTED